MKTSCPSDSEKEFAVIENSASDSGILKVSNIRPGDLVFCCTPGSEEFLASIPEGHRARPYLIVARKNSLLYGFSCSHKLSSRIPAWQQFELKKQDYPEFLYFGQLRPSSFSTCVSLDQLIRIPAENALSFSLHVHPDDFAQILRIYELISHLSFCSMHSGNRIPYPEPLNSSVSRLPGNIYHVHQDLYFLLIRTPDQKGPLSGLFIRRADDSDQSCERNGCGSLLITDIQNHRYLCTDFHTVYLEEANLSPFVSLISAHELGRLEDRLNSLRSDHRSVKSTRQFIFYWPSGSILLSESSQSEFIYLFSDGSSHCLADLEDFLDGDIQLIFADHSDLQDLAEQIDEISFEEILDFLRDENDFPHPKETVMLHSYSQFASSDSGSFGPDDPDKTWALSG